PFTRETLAIVARQRGYVELLDAFFASFQIFLGLATIAFGLDDPVVLGSEFGTQSFGTFLLHVRPYCRRHDRQDHNRRDNSNNYHHLVHYRPPLKPLSMLHNATTKPCGSPKSSRQFFAAQRGDARETLGNCNGAVYEFATAT